jgi:uncharacterized protein (DUF1501 family)
MSRIPRREFLNLSALAAGGALLAPRLSFASATRGKSRLVVVIMRGALDGLAAVPPYGDPDYARLRGDLALRPGGGPGGEALTLDGHFGLHPALGFLHDSFTARELLVFQAIASPYRERSHFDGQDLLENGTPRAHAVQTGWLNRALAEMPGRPAREAGVALGQNVPLLMRGPAAVTSWSPSKLTALDEDTLARITDLYAADKLLSVRLADALAGDRIAAEDADDAMMTGKPAMQSPAQPAPAAQGPGRYAEVVHAAAGFLKQEDGPQVAVFDTTGWDTHANEGGAKGQLAGRLAQLDAALATLKQQLGPVWNDTAVLLMTEFGRTAATNGTRGTDHGTATAAFLLGGAVAGGRVVTDWPGLAPRALYQGRDLAPTLDLRCVLKGLLADQLRVPTRALEKTVFPDSESARPLAGLLRG